jgi:phage terminase large subunit GpA-like protein
MHDESWFIDYKSFYGSPGRPDTWTMLDDYLSTKFKNENRVEIPILSVCIDSGGHFTQNVYDYTRRREGKRIYAVKGYGGYGRPFIGKASRNNKQRALVFPLGVDTAKELVYDRLQISEVGTGYMHFNASCNEDYFLQLTSEKHVTRYTKGFPTKVWVLKSGRRNEALDCEVYALAAFTLLNASMEHLAKQLEEKAQAIKSGVPIERKPPRIRPQRSHWDIPRYDPNDWRW